MVNSWTSALDSYDYFADLTKFKDRENYPGNGFTTPCFQTQVSRTNTRIFEDSFRKIIEERISSNFSVIGEVCFWKTYTKPNPHSLTKRILDRFRHEKYFNDFCTNLHILAENPTLEHFNNFRITCGQPHGFAVPITFLSFFKPDKYPMADSVIAHWWYDNKKRFGYASSHDFFPYGQISGQDEDIENNWDVYLRWMSFCQKYAAILTAKTQSIWRARDVEMAVFYNLQKGFAPLSRLVETDNPDKQGNKTTNIKSKINWFANSKKEEINYTPRQYPYWSTGSSAKRNVFRKKGE